MTPQEAIKRIEANANKEFAKAYKEHIKNMTGMFDEDGETFYIPLEAALQAVDFIYERMAGEG